MINKIAAEHDITVTVEGRQGCGKTTTIGTMRGALIKAGYLVTEPYSVGGRKERFAIDVSKSPFPFKAHD